MRIDLDKVPTRQTGMKAWELLLSESQERMLMVVEKGKEKQVLDIFEKWDLPCSNIGEVTDDKLLSFYYEGELEAVIPAEELVLGGGAPQYTREYSEPAYFEEIKSFDPDTHSGGRRFESNCRTTDHGSQHCFQKMDQRAVRQHGGCRQYIHQ